VKEVEAFKTARDNRTGMDEVTKTSAEKSVPDLVENIPKEREKKTGSAKCQ
jgi:hypothetical protein